MDVKELAERLDEAAMEANPIEQLSKSNTFNLDQAYEIQRLAIDARLDRGETLIGLKMGFTSEAKMKQMGVHDMIWGRLTSDMMIEDGEEVSLSNYIHPRAEQEVCFRISKDINHEVAFDDLDDYVDGIAAAIEIIDSRYENFKFTLEDVVADNCSSTGLVIGTWQKPHRAIANLRMRQDFNGKMVAEGSSAAILGDPWKSLQAATRLAAQYNQPIKAGHIIMAGAATAAEFLLPQTLVEVEVESLGMVSFKVAG